MDELHQSARVWEADLSETGRKLTLDELRALEAMHQCQNLARLVVASEAMLVHLRSLETRFDRLEQFLVRLDPIRYPKTPAPELTALPPGQETRS